MNRADRRALMREMSKQTHVCADGAYVLYIHGHGYITQIRKNNLQFNDGSIPAQVQRFHEGCANDAADMLRKEAGYTIEVRHQNTMLKGLQA